MFIQPPIYLDAMLREDPSLKVRQDADSGQTILSGMGDIQEDPARVTGVHQHTAHVGEAPIFL